jgi:hypothetical protein
MKFLDFFLKVSFKLSSFVAILSVGSSVCVLLLSPFLIAGCQASSSFRVHILYVPLITQQLAAWAGVGLVN